MLLDTVWAYREFHENLTHFFMQILLEKQAMGPIEHFMRI